MIKFIEKYYNITLVVLLIIIFIGSCRSCSKSQTYKFKEVEYNNNIDSLKTIISIQKDSIIDLNNTINILRESNKSSENIINNLKDNNNNLKDMNRYLKNKNR